MLQLYSVSHREQVVDTMIGLTRLTNLHRAIVAGSGSMELYIALRRRGFLRVATAATCRIPKGQHSVGLIAGRNSLQAIEAALVELSPFLGTSAAAAVLIDSREIGAGLRIRGSWSKWAFGSRPASGASRASCFPPSGTASARWKTRREILMTSVSNPATWLAGYIPDIPTPFDEEGAVDLAAYTKLCERQIEAGVAAILVSETSGEASTLTSAEQELVIRTAVEAAQGRVRVIAGAGSNSTSQAIELTQRAEAAGRSRGRCGRQGLHRKQ